MKHTLLLLSASLLLTACSRNGRCCKSSDCSEGSTTTSGSSVLEFRGKVPRNLLMISIDTLRKDHLGVYGNRNALSPFIDQIAAEGVVIRNHQVCSNWTFASTTCTLAGRSNIDRGHIPRLSGPEELRTPVDEGTPFLAGWMGDAGYTSALITSNSWMSKEWGNTQGYDAERSPGGNARALLKSGRELITERSEKGDLPWFLHVHLSETHAAYDPPEAYFIEDKSLEPWPTDLRDRDIQYEDRDDWPNMTPERQQLLADHLKVLYEGEVRTVDAYLEAEWKKYERECWLDDTLVVLWTDHGEAFWEHGYQTHAYNLTGEENDGALIFWSKNIVPGEWTGPTSAIDLVPTLLDLYDIPPPDEITGFPIGTAPDDRPIFAASVARLRGNQSVTQNGVKLQYNWGSGVVRVWDRNEDPLETNDLYDPNDDLTLDLWALLKPEVERMAPLTGGIPVPNYPADLP